MLNRNTKVHRIFLGIASVICTFYFFSVSHRFAAINTSRLDSKGNATVIDFKQATYNASTFFHPIINLEIDGKVFLHELPYGQPELNGGTWKNGQEMVVWYDSKNPEYFYSEYEIEQRSTSSTSFWGIFVLVLSAQIYGLFMETSYIFHNVR